MKLKSIFKDQSFWSLLIINVAIIVYYLQNHTGFKTLIWVYWAQSVLIGFFTFLQLATMRHVKPGSMSVGNETIAADGKGRGCLSLFFAVHYGFFHFGYFIFIFTITDAKEVVDWNLLKFSVAAFAIDQILNFIRLKVWEREHALNAGVVFFFPYARVIPMHFTILIPQFIGFIPQMGLFLVLKMFADLLMHAVGMKVYGSPQAPDPVTGKL